VDEIPQLKPPIENEWTPELGLKKEVWAFWLLAEGGSSRISPRPSIMRKLFSWERNDEVSVGGPGFAEIL